MGSAFVSVWVGKPGLALARCITAALVEANFSCYKIDMGMKAALAELEIVTKKGKPVSVILPIKQYQEMMERLEDAEDVAWLKKARRKKLHYRPLEEVLADLAKS